MKKFYCDVCQKQFSNGEEFCGECGNKLKPKKFFSPKNKRRLAIIIILSLVVIIASSVIHSIVNKDKIKFPGRLNAEARAMLTAKEERLVNAYVKDIITSYNEGDASNNYYKYYVYKAYEAEFDKMVENYDYYADDRDEMYFKLSLLRIPLIAVDIEKAAISGEIDGVAATPEEIKVYIEEMINNILEDIYY